MKSAGEYHTPAMTKLDTTATRIAHQLIETSGITFALAFRIPYIKAISGACSVLGLTF
jgi:hypothetical protein